MTYKVKLEATVEAESAEAAEQMAKKKAGKFAGKVEVVPTKEWTVDVAMTPQLLFAVTVNAESAEDAEEEAHSLVENASYRSGIEGVLELPCSGDYEIVDLDISVYDPEVIEDEEDDQPTQPATATAV